MSRPQPQALAAFQRQRSTQRRSAVLKATRKLDGTAEPITVAGVAALAGVDRSYIYSQRDLLDEIRGRRAAEPAKRARRPAADRATIASLNARLASAHEEIARLKGENRTLHERLAATLGEAWNADLLNPSERARIRR
jgi:hypothetical protein